MSLGNGNVTSAIPVRVVQKNTAKITINKDQLDKYKEDGWKKIADGPQVPANAPAPKPAAKKPAAGGTTEADKKDEAPEVKASKAAIKLLGEKGVDPSLVTGTGTDGAITVGDVKKYLASVEG